jgi:hypothetical protein
MIPNFYPFFLPDLLGSKSGESILVALSVLLGSKSATSLPTNRVGAIVASRRCLQNHV